jgi:hypothetical protein
VVYDATTKTGNMTEPAVGNVLLGVTYGTSGTEFTGTFNEAARNTDPGAANVLTSAGTYKILNSVKTPTFNEAARNTDPGVGNVKLATGYKIQNVPLVGTLASGGSTPGAIFSPIFKGVA